MENCLMENCLMENCLEGKVKDCVRGCQSTHIVLDFGKEKDTGLIFNGINFQLPLLVHAKPGDTIFLYDINIPKHEYINHDCYSRGIIYRKGKELLEFDAKDMRILTEIKGKEDHPKSNVYGF